MKFLDDLSSLNIHTTELFPDRAESTSPRSQETSSLKGCQPPGSRLQIREAQRLEGFQFRARLVHRSDPIHF